MKNESVRSSFLVFLFLALTAALVYGQSLSHPFVFDDHLQIVQNQAVHQFDLKSIFTGSTFTSFGGETLQGVYYKPFLTLTYSLLWKISGGESFAFHFFQLLLGTTCAFLFFLMLRSWISLPGALAASLIFLLHPLNSEVILYIADLQDLLFVFFGLLALRMLQTGKAPLWTGICLALSVLSKESGFLFVLLLPIYASFFKPRNFRSFLGVSLLVVAAYFTLRWSLAGLHFSHPKFPMAQATPGERILTYPAAGFYYLKTFFWPEVLQLNQNFLIHDFSFENVLLPFLALCFFFAGLGGTLWKSPKSLQKPMMYFLLVFTASHFLHSNLILPLDATAADRWFYPSSLGLIGFVAIVLDRGQFFTSGPRRIALGLSLLCAIVGLSVRSWDRAQDWQTGLRLFETEVRNSPSDPRHHNSLGLEYLQVGDLALAEKHFRQSVILDPKALDSWNNLGTLFDRQGLSQEAEICYLKSLEFGLYPLALENYGRLLLKQNRRRDLENLLEQGLRAFPRNPALLQIKSSLPAE